MHKRTMIDELQTGKKFSTGKCVDDFYFSFDP
jgi:hypothetical protein